MAQLRYDGTHVRVLSRYQELFPPRPDAVQPILTLISTPRHPLYGQQLECTGTLDGEKIVAIAVADRKADNGKSA
jgi:hypothetical protein